MKNTGAIRRLPPMKTKIQVILKNPFQLFCW